MKQTRRDPVTGDALTRGEYLSWIVQGIIRRWTFLMVITIVTLLVWATDNSTALTWWNLGASYLALVIESIVGIALFSQTRRDAIVMRETRAISQRIEKMAEAIERLIEHEEAELQQIESELSQERTHP